VHVFQECKKLKFREAACAQNLASQRVPLVIILSDSTLPARASQRASRLVLPQSCEVVSANAPSQLRRQSAFHRSLLIFSALRFIPPCRIPPRLPNLRPAGDLQYDFRGCATKALSCPSFDAVQHRLAASPVLRFTCSLAPPRPCLRILDLPFLHRNIGALSSENPAEQAESGI
jgi:hypothetical protein